MEADIPETVLLDKLPEPQVWALMMEWCSVRVTEYEIPLLSSEILAVPGVTELVPFFRSIRIEWIMDQYQVKNDKASQIKKDPNDWSDNPRYILDLLKRVITVSIETNKIVKSLPKLDEL